MCGIVGYVGDKEASSLLVDGLRKLEYRGYDSAGLAVHTPRGIEVVRAVGKLANLDAALLKTPLHGHVGIGHTRWATHGRPSERNAHPHVAGKIAVVHNGIIENHVELRRDLEARGVKFSSDTDTEIVAHLVDGLVREHEARAHEHHSEELPEKQADFASAVRTALSRLRGAFAVAILNADAPDQIIVAKNASPLVLGIGDSEMLAASDIPALLAHTRDVIFLEDGEMAVLEKSKITLSTIEGKSIDRKSKRIDWSPAQAEKGGYKHFMLKEIFEQPTAIEDTLRGRIDVTAGEIVTEEIGVSIELAKKITRVYFVACGTSSHSAIAARYWVEQLARIPSTVEIGSEVRTREPVFGPGDLVVAVSQSGETADTLAAVKTAKAAGAHILAVANVLDSAIPRMSDGALYTHAGPEIGVASTKCFTTQLAALLMLAVHLGRARGVLRKEEARRILDALLLAPHAMRDALLQAEHIKTIARKFQRSRDMLFLGRGTGFPIALEGALKLKEISYIHAEGYAAGEMKHGPIALIDEEMPVVVVAPRDAHYEKTMSNMHEVRAREGQVIAIVSQGDADISGVDTIEIPQVAPEIMPLITVLPLQLLAYFIADLKGTDVDQPRNLAKTVTVE